MDKHWLQKQTEKVVSDTRDALQLVFDSLNQGQQKKLLKNEQVATLLSKYEVNTGDK